MSLSGRLEDVSLVDVLQFVKLAGRSGTLAVTWGEARGEICMHEGNIINARAPSSSKVGEYLLAQGALGNVELERALALQRQEGAHRRPLGTLLVELGMIERSALVRALREQIEVATYELLSWQQGTFTLELEDVRPVDELALSPDELAAVNLDTQHVLLEAARILDERDRADEERPTTPPPAKPPPSAPGAAAAETAVAAGSTPEVLPVPLPDAGGGLPHLQLVSTDASLLSRLEDRVGGSCFVARVGLHEAAKPAHRLPAPILVVDLRANGSALRRLPEIQRARPTSTIIAIVEDIVSAGEAYASGATAVVNPDVGTILACARRLQQQERDGASERHFAEGLSAGFGKVRRLIGAIRHGVLSATPSLNILHLISDSVERGVFMLVRHRVLTCFGAFGHTSSGDRVAEHVRDLTIELERAGPLAACAGDAQARSGSWSTSGLPDGLLQRIGPPRSDRYAVFPVLGGDKVLAVVYADNGERNWPIEEIEFLELATTQMGLAFENALLRRQQARGAGP